MQSEFQFSYLSSEASNAYLRDFPKDLNEHIRVPHSTCQRQCLNTGTHAPAHRTYYMIFFCLFDYMVIYCLFIICHTHYIHVKWLQCSVHIFQKGSDIISSAYNSAWNKVDMNKYWLKNNINQINVLMLKQRNRNTQKVQIKSSFFKAGTCQNHEWHREIHSSLGLLLTLLGCLLLEA